MKRLILITFILLHTKSLLACDACSIYEFSPLQAKSYVGVFYSYSFMNGYNSLSNRSNFTFNAGNLRTYNNAHTGHLVEKKKVNPSQKDYESYQSVDVRFNYNLKNKWNFLINIPFAKNSIYFDEVIDNGFIDDSLRIHQGIGDILLAADKVSIIENNTLKHTFKYGLGIFLPTGTIKNEDNIDPAHYTGRGGFEPIFRTSYSLKVNQTWGILANFSYSTGTTYKSEDSEYQFGQRYNMQTNLFYSLKTETSGFIPMVGMYYEHRKSDYQNKNKIEGTQINALFTNFSLSYSFKSSLLRLEWQEPIAQKTSKYQLSNSGRLNLMLLYNF